MVCMFADDCPVIIRSVVEVVTERDTGGMKVSLALQVGDVE